MSVTPFLKPIKQSGGTFYTCASSQEDLNYTLDNSKRKFRFSNFAMLKIPPLKKLQTDDNLSLIDTTVPKPNYVQLQSPIGAYEAYNDSLTSNTQNNEAFAESFENYFYNFETILTNNTTYDIEQRRTVSERIFFKWLKEIGAMRFRQANSNEVVSTSAGYGTRFVEEDDSFDINGTPIYQKVVKYLGNINVVNSIKNQKNSFTEVYIHLPMSHGSTKDVLFDSISDINYMPDTVFQTENTTLNKRIIEGRDYTDVNPTGLSNLSHFDSRTNSNGDSILTDCWYFNPTTQQYEPSYISNTLNPNFKWWFDPSITNDNSYYLEPNGFSNVLNEVFAISNGKDSNGLPWDPNTSDVPIKFIRNTLDGISLEFNPNLYQKIISDSSINNLGEFNTSYHATNFSFNTVLIYYDIYDVDDPNKFVTNLFGILFLDDVEYVANEGGNIPSLTKYKPNSVLQQNGNSYAYRLNIKFDVNAQDAAIEVNINDYNTFSLQLYLDALTNMKLMASNMDDYVKSYKNLSIQVDELKSLIYTGESINDLITRITDIENAIANAGTVYLNNSNIVSLINKNYEEISNIYKNYTSINMSYNLDVIKQGSGIEIDKSSGTYVKINNTKQSFSLGSKPVVFINTDFAITPVGNNTIFTYNHILTDFDNYLRINDGSYNTPYIIDRDIVIYVDDSLVVWQKGQRMRLSFSYGLDMSNTNGNFNLLIYSDAKDKLNTGYIYNAQIAAITYDNFNSLNKNKPIIELICINPTTYQFVVDIF